MGEDKIMATALTVISTVASVFKGFAAKRAADREAEALQDQASLQREETGREAARVKDERRKFLAKQSLAFVKGGVTLEGSPLLVLEETQTESEKEVQALKTRGAAQFALGTQKAGRAKSIGRSKLIGGFGEAFGTASTLKIFGGSV